ncbi:MAG: enoyl-CoA hydratase-related protein [Alphaproteobacteria bacterium]|nr:enoyl-CoA hydratase-related protein [Alphaproteobacteria bacterium]
MSLTLPADAPVKYEQNGRVAILTINRPKAKNALNSEIMRIMFDSVCALDMDDSVGCIIITGAEGVFAAGADISEMSEKTLPEMATTDMFGLWQRFANTRTPIIAAVAGFALGGGCELAMMCDIIIAAEGAKFGQPEIKLGIIPGMGGSQRLTRAVGKFKAMEIILTGRLFDAAEAERIGLASIVTPAAQLQEKALEMANIIAGYGKMAAIAAKEAVRQADEMPLSAGLLFERRVFHSLFATHDQKEGMAAFKEKRAAKFTHN